MSDKDQFTFDDGDDFPEADLSSAFADGEFEADNQAPEVQEEILPPQKGKKAKTAKAAKSDGGARTRLLLILLLLVVVAGAGAYYFMGLGETTPSVPTAPAKEAKTAVALPPQPAKPAPAEPASQAVTVAVPPPPSPAPAPAQDPKPTASAPQPAAPEVKETPQAVAAQASTPAPEVKAEPAKPAEPAEPVAQPVVAPPPPEPAAEPKTVVAPAQVAGGAFALDAGSYLFDENRDALTTKLKQLGYEPLITPVEATLDMTRLRLGTFSKDEVQQALDFARSIEPGSYSAPAGENYVIYAGTFLSKGSIDTLTKRFAKEGIKVHPEPVQVVRTLSRIRFGSFATKADAEAAAKLVDDKGVKAVVVKAK